MTIWDSTESEFASGLEYRGEYRYSSFCHEFEHKEVSQSLYSETILDLDWSSTPDMQSILAVGFAHRIDILCEQRMTYFDEGPGWGLCRTIDISRFAFEIFRRNSLTFSGILVSPPTLSTTLFGLRMAPS